jgi:hypothetical protein
MSVRTVSISAEVVARFARDRVLCLWRVFVLVLRRGWSVGDAVGFFGADLCSLLAWRRARGLGGRCCLGRSGGLIGGVGDGVDCCFACFLALRRRFRPIGPETCVYVSSGSWAGGEGLSAATGLIGHGVFTGSVVVGLALGSGSKPGGTLRGASVISTLRAGGGWVSVVGTLRAGEVGAGAGESGLGAVVVLVGVSVLGVLVLQVSVGGW